MTITADPISAFALSNLILPARERGQGTVMIGVREVWKALNGEFPLDHIRGVIGSMGFRNGHRLALIAVEGDGEPDTYVFKFRSSMARGPVPPFERT